MHRKLPHYSDTHHTAPQVDGFDVDGDASKITTNEEGTKILRYTHDGFVVTIQMWPTLKLSDKQLIEFADGVAVTDEAKVSLG